MWRSFAASSKKEKVIAAIFSVAVCYLIYTLRNYFSGAPVRSNSKVFHLASSGHIDPNVKKTLDALFQGSSYGPTDNLPSHPSGHRSRLPREELRKNMTHPVMKGILRPNDSRPFIAIKVDCTLSEENVKSLKEFLREKFSNQEERAPFEELLQQGRRLEDCLILMQDLPRGALKELGYGECLWSEISQHDLLEASSWSFPDGEGESETKTSPENFLAPHFFSANLTSPKDGNGPVTGEEDNFANVQKLLQGEARADLNGLIWKIPE